MTTTTTNPNTYTPATLVALDALDDAITLRGPAAVAAAAAAVLRARELDVTDLCELYPELRSEDGGEIVYLPTATVLVGETEDEVPVPNGASIREYPEEHAAWLADTVRYDTDGDCPATVSVTAWYATRHGTVETVEAEESTDD